MRFARQRAVDAAAAAVAAAAVAVAAERASSKSELIQVVTGSNFIGFVCFVVRLVCLCRKA